MTEEYLYDPRRGRPRKARARSSRKTRRVKKVYTGPRGGKYFQGPHARRYDPRRRKYDPGRSKADLMDNLLVLGGAALDSYLTTKYASKFGMGFSVPTVAGKTITMPYLEGLGIAGGIALPLVSRNKWAKIAGKVLTGMGANGIAKVFDPPNPPSEAKEVKKEKSEVEKLLEVY
jgi:hypothetical protein